MRFGTSRVLSAVLLLVCAASARSEDTIQPSNWNAGVRLSEPADRNPDPKIVEIDLDARVADAEISPGRHVQAWTYNGSLPGPLIRVHVGDRLIVHFKNLLPQPTTVHWHGIRLPIQMDGVPGVSQPEVRTGESFTYDFVVPDAGLFWYHPHVMSAAQVGFGLYGALLVDDPSEQVGVAHEDELVLVLSDISIDDTTHALEPPDSGGSTGMAFGREGNHVLVNGREGGRLVVRSGAPERWRIVNTAKSRYFQLDLEGQRFTKIGDDGGRIEYPVESTSLVIGAGERADVLVTPRGKPGTELVLRTFPFNRGYGSVEYRSVDDLLTVAIADLPAYAGDPLPISTLRRTIEPLNQAGATDVKIDLTLVQKANGTFEYGINGVPFSTGRPIVARLGETQIWTVTNKTKWSHPLHLHGFFFQVLDKDGAPVRPLAWKDTVNVPLEDTLRFIVRFDDDRPGSWMFHCHILDHADGGLMGMVDLGVKPAAPHVEHSHGQEP